MILHGAHERHMLLVDRHYLAGVAGLMFLYAVGNVAFGEANLEVAVGFTAEEIFLPKQVHPALFH